MFLEILFGIILALVLLYLFYLYLEWSEKWAVIKATYETMPAAVPKADAAYLDKNGWASPSEVISDTYKYTNFWLQYYYTRTFLV
jgi:hypothetical protein